MTFMPEPKPYERYLQCKCGQLFKNNMISTKCGMCTIAELLEDPKEIAAVIYFVVSKSDIQNKDLKQITRDILNDKLSNQLIELGLEDNCINKINNILNNNTPQIKYARIHLAELLKEQGNIFEFIKILLKKFHGQKELQNYLY